MKTIRFGMQEMTSAAMTDDGITTAKRNYIKFVPIDDNQLVEKWHSVLTDKCRIKEWHKSVLANRVLVGEGLGRANHGLIQEGISKSEDY